jgi:signal transduction histidine kinase
MCRKGCIHAETPAGPHACRDRDKCLHLLASSGRYTHIDGKVHGRVPLGSYKIGRLASGEEHGFLTNDVQNDPRIHSNRWARELGLISFGGYRMKASDGKTLGVLAFFAKQPVPEDEGAMIDGISSSAALAIQQADTEKTLREALKNLQDTQEQLIQTGKLASIGQLAAGIAHEINNPLGFILSNTETLHTYMKELTAIFRGREDLKRSISDKGTEKTGSPEPPLSEIEEGSDVKYVLNDIESILKESTEGLERIKKIVMDLKVFARKEEEAKSPVNLNDLLDGVINIVWNEIKYKAELKKDYGQIPQVLCRSQRMGQVFINLFINAVQAIERSGTISVRTYSDAKQVYVEISDTGKGIPEENMSKIFEPFFTTREDGKGTGLGLSISYDIVKAHNGTITVESMVGKGSKFTVSLPV